MSSGVVPVVVRWMLRVACVTALVGSLWVMVRRVNMDPEYYDEVMRLYGAERLLRGDMPHRDFYFIHVAGELYLAAFVFKVAGTGILPYRIAIFALTVAKLLVIWALARQISDGWTALAVSVVATIVAWNVPKNAYEPALMLILIAVLLLWRWVGSENAGWLIGGAACLGLAGWFRWDWSTMAAGGAALATFARPVVALGERRRLGRVAGVAVLVAGWSATLVAGLLLMYGPDIAAFYRGAILLPMEVMRHRNLAPPMPVPPNPLLLWQGALSWAAWLEILWRRSLFYAPLLLAAAAAVIVFRRAKGTASDRLLAQRLALLVMVALPFYAYASLRSDPPHTMPVVLLTLPVAAGVLAQVSRCEWRLGRTAGRAAGAMVLIALASWPVPEALRLLRVPRRHYELKRARGMVGPTQRVRDYEAAVRCVQALTDGPIFSASYRHDAVFTSDMLFYFLSGRHSATGLYHFEPGLTDTAEGQRRIVNDLERSRARVVVRWRHSPSTEPNRSQWGTGVRLLDRYLERRYRTYRRFGDHEVCVRIDRGRGD